MTTPAFTFRPLDPLRDAELLHSWVAHPKAAFWMMQDAKLEDVERAYMEIAADEHHHALLGLDERGAPAFLMERYDPAHRELTGLYGPGEAVHRGVGGRDQHVHAEVAGPELREVGEHRVRGVVGLGEVRTAFMQVRHFVAPL